MKIIVVLTDNLKTQDPVQNTLFPTIINFRDLKQKWHLVYFYNLLKYEITLL